jgi:hypothetical protein
MVAVIWCRHTCSTRLVEGTKAAWQRKTQGDNS